MLEHYCGIHHYGDMTMVRECCVSYAKEVKENAQRVAMTDRHPGYRLWCDVWNGLTDAEMMLVGDYQISIL